MVIKNADVFDVSGGFVRRDIFTYGELISNSGTGEIIEADGLYAVPGLIDIHTHGCVGHEYYSATAEDIRDMRRYEARRGVTAICPTLLTLPEDVLSRSCALIAANDCADGADVSGINLEGPFLSPKKLGAQNPAYIHKPDAQMLRRIQDAAGGLVRIVSVAPEVDGALDFIRDVKSDPATRDIVCSIAHTVATYDEAKAAYDAGARHVTHLYNAMPVFGHRDPSVIGAVYDTKDAYVELICDNIHIHPTMVRAMLAMFGTGDSNDRVTMISDSMMATGLGDGDYEIGGLPVRVTGRTARLSAEGSAGAIAGSVTDLMGCVTTAVKEMNIPLHTAVKCAAVNPASAIGAFGRRGSIDVGKIADVVLLNRELCVKVVILRGLRVV